MAFTVELIRRKKKGSLENKSEIEIYKLNVHFWETILEIGKDYGWLPLGTVLEDSIESGDLVRSDYKICSWGDVYKVFTNEDALSLAAALEVYIDNENIIDEKYQIHRIVSESLVEDIIAFLKKGAFIFVWDD